MVMQVHIKDASGCYWWKSQGNLWFYLLANWLQGEWICSWSLLADISLILVASTFVGLTFNDLHFQNKCNVGYAFINMINPENIVPFYKVRFCNISRTYSTDISSFNKNYFLFPALIFFSTFSLFFAFEKYYWLLLDIGCQVLSRFLRISDCMVLATFCDVYCYSVCFTMRYSLIRCDFHAIIWIIECNYLLYYNAMSIKIKIIWSVLDQDPMILKFYPIIYELSKRYSKFMKFGFWNACALYE